MKKVKKILLTAVLTLGIGSMVACGNIASNNTILAQIDGTSITLNDVDKELTPLINYLIEEYGEDFEKELDESMLDNLNIQRQNILNQLISDKVSELKAKQLNLIPNDEELKKLQEEKRKELIEAYGDEETLKTAIKESGYNDDEFNNLLRSQVISDLVFNYIVKDISVSDEEIKTFYDENVDNYFTVTPGGYVQHILFTDEDNAKEAKKSIDNGTNTFKELFDSYINNNPNDAAPIAEDLGYIEYNDTNYAPEFMSALKKLKADKVSSVVKTDFGYHLIVITDINNKEEITPLEDVKDIIESNLLADKQYEAYQNALIEYQKEFNVSVTMDSISSKEH